MENVFNRNPDCILYFAIPILLLFISLNSNAQKDPVKTVHFSYDVNGNREHRWITIEKMANDNSADSLNHDSPFKNNIVKTNNLNTLISLYPNPTRGLLDLKVTGLKAGESVEYVFVSLTGQELLRKKTGLSVTQIDINNFAPGTYIVNVKTGERTESWKIIRH